MNARIADEIQAEQDHGRQKYGGHKDNLAHDSKRLPSDWYYCIADHNKRAIMATPMERRQHLIKVAGLAVSAIEEFDRSRITTP